MTTSNLSNSLPEVLAGFVELELTTLCEDVERELVNAGFKLRRLKLNRTAGMRRLGINFKTKDCSRWGRVDLLAGVYTRKYVADTEVVAYLGSQVALPLRDKATEQQHLTDPKAVAFGVSSDSLDSLKSQLVLKFNSAFSASEIGKTLHEMLSP